MHTPAVHPTGIVFYSDATRSWVRKQVLLLLAGAAALLLVFEFTDLDRQFARLFFNPETGEFPLRYAWLFDAVLHKGAKQAAFLLAAACFYLCWQGWRHRLPWLPPRNALLAALGMVAIPIATVALKHITNRHCPWDMTDFGGFAPYLRLLDPTPPGLQGGECFPAGHASAGFLWIVWGVALRPAGQRWTRLGLLTGLLAGGVLGLARMMQGAHFLSHTLWTLWLAWALSVALALLVKADLKLGINGTAQLATPPETLGATPFSPMSIHPADCAMSEINEAVNAQKHRRGLSRLFHALRYSIAGLVTAWQEPAFRQEAILAIPMLPAAFWLGRDWTETVLLAGSVMLVMIVELINTAVESAIDRMGSEWHVLSKRAKDTGSAAVLLCLVLCAGVWLTAVARYWT